jgi:hypothetical protein
MSYTDDIVAALIEAFEKKAGNEIIVAACLIDGHRDGGEEIPRDIVSWRDACEYLEIAGPDYPAPLCIAWTETRVLMPVTHEMGRRSGVWCITAPRNPVSGARFPVLYDCNDPE